MAISPRIAALLAAVLAVAGLASAGPASALAYPTITSERTGANPIVAGADTGTTFKVTVTNPDQVNDMYVFVSGVMEPGVYLTDVQSDGGGCTLPDSSSYLCEPPTAPSSSPVGSGVSIPAGGSMDVTLTAVAASWAPEGTYDLCSYAEPAGNDAASKLVGCGAGAPNGAALVALSSVDVVRQADLALLAIDAPQTDPGATADVIFQPMNAGPSTPGSYKLTGTLPVGLTYVSATSDAWTCAADGQVVTCELFLLQRTSSAALPPVAWTVATAKPGKVKQYDVPAQLTSDDATDPTPEDARATAVVPVTPVRLSIGKAASGPAKVGEQVQWAISVTNTGTIDDAGEITVTDTLPASMRYVSAAGDGWTCAASGQKVTCTRVGLAKGASSSIVLTAKVTEGGRLQNTASVTSQSYVSSDSTTSATGRVLVSRLAQTAKPLPATPARIVSGKTEQGRKITTRVRCRPALTATAGEVSYCQVTRRDGVVRVRVIGDQKMAVVVTQTAPGTKKYRPFLQRKVYVVKP